jgi:hypothetical protein
MLKLYSQVTAMVAAALICGSAGSGPSLALSTSVNPSMSEESMAMLTAKSGEVWKQDFVDWQKEIWGREQQANINDRLHEGMRLGTGNNSWAEVSWPNVKTRVWSNSQFAVAPNKRLVYLTQGEMLFRLDKHRKDKDQPYYIWTKVLQARIRGTTVLVQSQGSVTRFSVMEGVVDITNRLDHSRVTIKPGVVYEVVGYPQGKPSTTESSSVVPITEAPKKIDGTVTDILYDKAENSKIPIFQDRCSSSNVYPTNSEALMHHPLINCGSVIDSMALIEKEQKDLPGFNQILPLRSADQARLDRLVASAVEVRTMPGTADYFVGQDLGKSIRLPQQPVANIPPRGVIINTQRQMPIVQAKVPVMAPPPPVIFHQDNTEAAELLPTSDLQPLPVKEYGSRSTPSHNQSADQPTLSTTLPCIGAVGDVVSVEPQAVETARQ